MRKFEKWEQKKLDELMGEKGFMEYAEQEHNERLKVGAFRVREDIIEDIVDSFSDSFGGYEDGWYWHKVANKLKNNDKKTVDTMNSAFEEMGNMSIDDILGGAFI